MASSRLYGVELEVESGDFAGAAQKVDAIIEQAEHSGSLISHTGLRSFTSAVRRDAVEMQQELLAAADMGDATAAMNEFANELLDHIDDYEAVCPG